MKKFLTSLTLAALLTSCATFKNGSLDPILMQTRDAVVLSLLNQLPSASQKLMAGYYAEAFGDALRTLEGTEVSLIPGQIAALRRQWLPTGDAYSSLVGSLTQIYLSQHPASNAQAQAVLEAIAMGLQTPR